MDRFRRTLSFRSRKKKRKAQEQTESAQPHQWQEDDNKVRDGTCSFQVKYLGCMEVYESRGMQVCEEAHKTLRQNAKKSHRISFRKKVKKRQKVVQAIIYVSGDSLRVIEDKAGVSADDGQGLIVDQTIEKVSFCAPDRNHEKGFSYICRDGTTRRWMCHGFLALKESGERLSHAVGCAFGVCLERKQKREKEAVSVSYNDDKTSFSRLGSFRQATLTERLADPQSTKVVEPIASNSGSPSTTRQNMEIAQVERPHASANLLLRQGSFNTFNKLNSQTSPFKRNLSLRLNELPSNLSRQQADFDKTNTNVPIIEGEEPIESPPQSAKLASALTGNESGKQAEALDPIAEMCQQLTRGLTGLDNEEKKSKDAAPVPSQPTVTAGSTALNGVDPVKQPNPWSAPAPQENDFWLPPTKPLPVSASVTQQSAIGSTSVAPTATSPVRPRPSAGASTQYGLLSQPVTSSPASSVTIDPFKLPSHSTTNQQVYSNNNTGLTNGGMSAGIVAPLAAANPQNPFDTAWALRHNPSTNPFLTGGSVTSPSSASSTPQASSQTQFSKEFELKM
ncbi:protein numb-like isoform X1 [Watersipora subatra]|uniref:protein numb-like isoform X1 n=1 Tax=Watersipora subatra TaxID=2589382 RepID=UPI00355C2573